MVLLAAGPALSEFNSPTGRKFAPPMPVGMLAWEFGKEGNSDATVRELIREQEEAGFTAPPGFLLVGTVTRRYRKEAAPGATNEANESVVWTYVMGARFEIFTTEETRIRAAAGMLLILAKQAGIGAGRKFEVTEPDGTVQVNILNAEQRPHWPYVAPRARLRTWPC